MDWWLMCLAAGLLAAGLVCMKNWLGFAWYLTKCEFHLIEAYQIPQVDAHLLVQAMAAILDGAYQQGVPAPMAMDIMVDAYLDRRDAQWGPV